MKMKMMKMNMFSMLLLLAGLVALFYVYCLSKEGFSNMSMGSFPTIIMEPLLQCFYPVKKEQALHMVNYGDIAKDQPRTEMSSYEQVTNNFKFWETPNNGTCTPAEFCGTIYDMKHIEKSDVSQPNDALGTRVNYYISQ